MPDAPPSIFTPPSAGSAPAAPGGIFEVPGGGSAPAAAGGIFVPPIPAGSIPDTLTVTADPGTGEVTIELERGSDSSGYATWSDGGDWMMSAYQESPETVMEWLLSGPGYDAYKPVGGTSSPVGLTGWSLTFGGEQPAITAAGYEPTAAPAAIFTPPIDGGSPSAPPPIFGMPVSALYNSNYVPLLNTDDTLLTTTDA